MDAQQFGQLKPMLRRYLGEFDDCFARKDTRAHLSKYVEGQLSDLGRKSVEPIALKVGVPVRTCKSFSASIAGTTSGCEIGCKRS